MRTHRLDEFLFLATCLAVLVSPGAAVLMGLHGALHGDPRGWPAVILAMMAVGGLARASAAGLQSEFAALARPVMVPALIVGGIGALLLH